MGTGKLYFTNQAFFPTVITNFMRLKKGNEVKLLCIAILMESEIYKKVKGKIGIKLMENDKISSFLEEKNNLFGNLLFFLFSVSKWLQPFNIKSDFQMMIIFVDYETSSEGNHHPLEQKLLRQKETPNNNTMETT